MADRITIRDFLIAVGFEGKDAQKGLQELQTTVNKLSKSLHNAFGQQRTGLGKMIGGYTKLNNLLERRLTLERELSKLGFSSPKPGTPSKSKDASEVSLRRARIAAQRQEITAIRAGTDVSGLNISDTVKGKDIKKIKELTLALTELNTAQKKVIANKRSLNQTERENEKKLNRETAVINKRVAMMRQLTRLEALGGKDTRGIERQMFGTSNLGQLERMSALLKEQVVAAERVERSKARQDAADRKREADARKADKENSRRFERQEARKQAAHRRSSVLEAMQSRMTDSTGKFLGTSQQASNFRRAQRISRVIAESGDEKTVAKARTMYASLIRELKSAERAAKKTKRQFDFLTFTQRALADSTRNLARSYVSVFAVVGGAGGTLHIGQEMMATNAAMIATTGSTELAAEAMDYVIDRATVFGANIKESAKAFSRIKAGADSANLSLEETKNIYEAALESSTVFQLSQEETTGVLRAFQQILSYPIAPSYREVC